MARPDNARIAEVFDATAPQYDRQIGFSERRLLGNPRRWAIGHASGRVLEIAVGTGLNLPLYGPDVTEVTGIDLSAGMLAHAQQRIADHRLTRCEVRRGDVQALDLADESVDTVVSTLSYCTIPDPAAASAEAMRVLVPGGRFVLVEHGPSTAGSHDRRNTLDERLRRSCRFRRTAFGSVTSWPGSPMPVCQ